MGWSKTQQRPGLLALGSFLTDRNKLGAAENKLCIVEHDQPREPFRITSVAEAPHPLPISHVQWSPASAGDQRSNWLATTGDALRLWRLSENHVLSLEAQLINVRGCSQSPVLLFVFYRVVSNGSARLFVNEFKICFFIFFFFYAMLNSIFYSPLATAEVRPCGPLDQFRLERILPSTHCHLID
jgi:hypothetical protein